MQIGSKSMKISFWQAKDVRLRVAVPSIALRQNLGFLKIKGNTSEPTFLNYISKEDTARRLGN